MSIQDQARERMTRHQMHEKNRHDSMLARAAESVGLPAESLNRWNPHFR